MNKKVLIFGVTGQAGSYLSEKFLREGYDVYGVNRRTSLPNDGRLSIAKTYPNFHIVEGDITDSFSVADLISKIRPAYIANAAAQSHVATSFEQPAFTWNANALGVLNVLEAVRTVDKNIKVVQFSTSEMFGSEYSIRIDENGVKTTYQDENTPMFPQSPYAIAKLAGHHLIRNYRNSYSMNLASAIFFNMESPRRGEKFVTRKITKYIGQLMNFSHSTPKLKLGNIDARRDWGHCEDYMECIYKMFTCGQNRDYVISTGKTISVRDFLEVAFNYVGKKWEDYVEIDSSLYRPSEVAYLHGDSSLVQRDLGWTPKRTVYDIVKEMVDHDILSEKR
jgi:GDPmannose 4,6-dehydratase